MMSPSQEEEGEDWEREKDVVVTKGGSAPCLLRATTLVLEGRRRR